MFYFHENSQAEGLCFYYISISKTEKGDQHATLLGLLYNLLFFKTNLCFKCVWLN